MACTRDAVMMSWTARAMASFGYGDQNDANTMASVNPHTAISAAGSRRPVGGRATANKR